MSERDIGQYRQKRCARKNAAGVQRKGSGVPAMERRAALFVGSAYDRPWPTRLFLRISTVRMRWFSFSSTMNVYASTVISDLESNLES